MDHDAVVTTGSDVEQDVQDLHALGYKQTLRRTIGAYTSFALGFSMITITTTIFTLFSQPFQTLGGAAIWLWIPVTLGALVIAAVYGHLAARLPITGYAYQWSSRLVGPNYGWFNGWTALISFFTGTASIGLALATVFAPEFIANPTHLQTATVAAGAIAVAVLLNIISIRAATFFNNVGASAELVGTLGLTAITAIGLLFFEHQQGFAILTQVGPTTPDTPVNHVAWGLALLLPVYTLLGWEGSADLAEETVDPRRTAPNAMFRSILISGVAAFFVFAVFAMAIPGNVADIANATDTNPLILVFQAHFPAPLVLLLKVIVFLSIFSALLANVTVATRMCFSLARDRMLPASPILARVSTATRTPIASVVLVGIVAIGINYLSAGLIAQVTAITAVTYFLTYLLTMLSGLIGSARGTIPTAPARYMNLGPWLRPLCMLGIAWTLVVIAYMTLPEVNHPAGLFTIYFEVAGVVWFFAYLRPRLARGEVGPPIGRAVSDPTLSVEEREIVAESRV